MTSAEVLWRIAHGILPLVMLKANAAGDSHRNTEIGDMTLGTALGRPSPTLHLLAGVDVFAPTGGYHRTDLGAGHHSAVQSLEGVTWTPTAPLHLCGVTPAQA